MCQSISITAQASELTERFELDNVLFYISNRYEVNPTDSVSAIIETKNGRILDEFRWGMVPYWARDSVRMDSSELFDKPIYERIANKQRCIIPCTGFYVTRTIGKEVHRMKLTMRSGTFAIAGLYDVFRPASGEEMRTCTMLMTSANSHVSPYQPLMPAILEQEDIGDWLQRGSRTPYELRSMLRPMDALRMVAIPLSPSIDDMVDFESPRTEWGRGMG
ncbi:SOS response-associated peptidase [Paenibacillus sp. CF384]|uniref:SOS response-associated peptidase n=1 Tax=Paenibacillus sp. CF384 TaxID=1884382 RepID=UPI00089B8764|nr:SOS response-associated peptidase [Paenibacillus sp. CF384]SDW68356.1 Putative SOS response-associated peptidase YedK [Paenibacillus sp. CF384]